MIEEIELTAIDIPVLEIHYKIYYRAGYKHATVKAKTIDSMELGAEN